MVKVPAKYTNVYIGLVIATGLMAVVQSIAYSGLSFTWRFAAYFLLALFSSGLKVSLPGVTGTMSVSYIFILTGVAELTEGQTFMLGLTSALVQIYWKAKKRPKIHQVLFNLAVIAVAMRVSHAAFQSPIALTLGGSLPVKLLLATMGYFLANTFPIACAISLTERRSLPVIWKECYFWAFPYYLLAATIVGIINWVNINLGWQFSLLALPVAWVLFRSYRLYIGRLEAEKEHVEQMNGLHIRTIEALTLAIEAKDHTTHDHLRRVQHYALEIGKEVGLTGPDLDALHAASLLHDIGKLAVPEHIISKPGKLTPQEFEKMKIHPLVGAEILEQVNFPYPVAPIVKAHHEKWDGNGYPCGLKGEEIPIGARILSAVDCLDALASDRQYRRALPLDQAMEVVKSESGKSYDPKIVEILARRYRQLEEEAVRLNTGTRLSVNAKVDRGKAPAAGFEANAPEEQGGTYMSQIAAAGREAQHTLELVTELGNSLSMSETLSVLSSRLTQLIPCDSIAVYQCKDEKLTPVYVDGPDRMLFSSLKIPYGEGLSGWVAKHNKAILNGNPSVEPGYLNDPTKFSLLRSALAVPLSGGRGIVGVLTMYRADADAFNRDHLRILSGITAKIGLSFENALKFQALEASATTDYLTGLNNTRSLFERLNHEISQCKRQELPLTVMVCDLDGFKQVNDRFGHNAGNRVLQVFAKGLEKVIREHDVTARFGGDEFVIVFPGMKAESVSDKIRLISNLATEAGLEVCGETITAASVGVSSFPDEGATPDELLAEADRKMYAYKKARKQRALNLPEAELPVLTLQ